MFGRLFNYVKDLEFTREQTAARLGREQAAAALQQARILAVEPVYIPPQPIIPVVIVPPVHIQPQVTINRDSTILLRKQDNNRRITLHDFTTNDPTLIRNIRQARIEQEAEVPHIADQYINNLYDIETIPLVKGITKQGPTTVRTYKLKNPEYEPSALAFIRNIERRSADGDTILLYYRLENGEIKTIKLERNIREPFLHTLNSYGFEISENGDEIIYNSDIDVSHIVENIFKEYDIDYNRQDIVIDKYKFKIETLRTTVAGIKYRKYNTRRYEMKIIKGYYMYNPLGDDNNCLIKCLLKYFDSNTDPDQIRRNCNFPIGTELGSEEDIVKLEKYFGKTIAVLVGKNIDKIPLTDGDKRFPSWKNLHLFSTEVKISNRYLRGNDDCDIILYFEDHHCYLISGEMKDLDKYCRISGEVLKTYEALTRGHGDHRQVTTSLIKQGRLSKEGWENLNSTYIKPDIFTGKYPVFFSFDFETVYNDDRKCIPITAAIVKYTYDSTQEKYITLENDEYRFSCAAEDCASAMFTWLCYNSNSRDENIFIGYNIGNYDDFLMLVELLNANRIQKNSVKMNHNSILDIQWGKYFSNKDGRKYYPYRTIDLNRFIPGSLEENCRSFGVTHSKLSMNHDIIQECQFKASQEQSIYYFIDIALRKQALSDFKEYLDFNEATQEELNKWWTVLESISTSEGQYHYNPDRYPKEIQPFLNDYLKGIDKLIEYNIRDCIATAELFFKVRESLSEAVLDENGENLLIEDSRCFTMPSLVFKYWPFNQKALMDVAPLHFTLDGTTTAENYDILNKQAEKFSKFCRKAAIGGRAQVFRKGKHQSYNGGRFMCLDANGLYPFVMMAPECYYPIGQAIWTNKEVHGKLGIYRCDIPSQAKLPTKVVPARLDDKGNVIQYRSDIKFTPLFPREEYIAPETDPRIHKYDWDTKEPLRNYNLSSVKLQTLREAFKEYDPENLKNIKVYDGYYWEKCSNKVFYDYIKRFAEIKMEETRKRNLGLSYNKSLLNMVKFILVSLSGKLLERPIEKENKLLFKEEDYVNFYATHSKVDFQSVEGALLMGGNIKIDYLKSKPLHLGVFLYDYAQRHMYLSIWSKSTTKILTDTDSCLVNSKSPDIATLLELGEDNVSSDPLLGEFGRFHMGNKFGEFKDEFATDMQFPVNEVYAIAPKFYLCNCLDNLGREIREIEVAGKTYYTSDDINIVEKIKDCKKVRCCGVNKNDKRLTIGIGQFNKLGNKERLDLWNSLGYALTTELYQDMIDNKEVNIMCFRINRSLIDRDAEKGFTLSQSYVYKELNKIYK